MSDEKPVYNGLPINLFLTGRPCLVVGGGKVAMRKIHLLLDAGADVAVVSPEVCEEVAGLIEAGRFTHTVREFKNIGQYRFPTSIMMINRLRKDTYTELLLDNVELDIRIPDRIFTKAYLERK